MNTREIIKRCSNQSINLNLSLSGEEATAFCLKSPFPRFCVVLFFSLDEDDADFYFSGSTRSRRRREIGRSWPIVTWRSGWHLS